MEKTQADDELKACSRGTKMNAVMRPRVNHRGQSVIHESVHEETKVNPTIIGSGSDNSLQSKNFCIGHKALLMLNLRIYESHIVHSDASRSNTVTEM